MTKIVCLVLLVTVVFCSVVGFSCNDFNRNLISLSNTVIYIQDEAISILKSLFSGFEDHFLSGEFVDTGDNLYDDDDDYEFIEYSHDGCIISLVNSNLGIIDNASTKALIKPNLYTVEIKTNGEYYTCYAMCYLFADTVYYVIVNTPEGAEHLCDKYFINGAFSIATFYSPYTLRLYRNLTKTELTLSEIEHTCILTED